MLKYPASLEVLEDLVTASGLEGSFEIYTRVREMLESKGASSALTAGELQLGRRGLWPNISIKGAYSEAKVLSVALSLMDGKRAIDALSHGLGLSQEENEGVFLTLLSEGLIEI